MILLTTVRSGIVFAYVSTREANTTWQKPNINAEQYHSPYGEYNCGAIAPLNPNLYFNIFLHIFKKMLQYAKMCDRMMLPNKLNI